MKERESKAIFCIAALLCTAVWFWIACRIPYTHDDWDWGLSIGIQHLLTADINSRYTGNLLEVIMTRSPLLKSIFLGCTYAAIPLFCTDILQRVLPEDSRTSGLLCYLLSNGILWLTAPDIWGQTFGWVAGAANYIFSVLAVLVFIRILWGALASEDTDASLFSSVLLFLFGVAMQLFLENVTVVVTVAAALAFVGFHFFRKRWNMQLGLLLAGNLIGAVIMFSSTIYLSLLQTGAAVGGYREVAFGLQDAPMTLILQCLRNYISNLLPQTFLPQNRWLCGLIFLLLGVHCTVLRASVRKKSILLVCNLLILLLLVLGINTHAVNLLLVLVGCADCIFLYCMSPGYRPYGVFMLCLWLAIPAVVAPLAVITEKGPRLFLLPYVLLGLFLTALAGMLYSRMPKRLCKAITGVAAVLVLVLAVRWSWIYWSIGQCSARRAEVIRLAKAGIQTEITLEAYPYSEYLWVPDPHPKNESRCAYFREFYGIPENVILHFPSRE